LRYRAFAREYAKDHNATRAYKAVYPNCNTDQAAAVNGSRLLTNAKVRQLVDELEAEAARAARIDVQRILRETTRLAFLDPRRLFHADGRMKKPQELDDDTAAAVGGIERVVEKRGKKTIVTYRYKVLDKNASLERLFKHKGLFRPEAEIPPPPSEIEEDEEDLVSSARRIAFTLELAGRMKVKAAK